MDEARAHAREVMRLYPEFNIGHWRQRPPYRDGPDALAVSEDPKVYVGILAAGTHGSSVVAMNGTSVAAPRIARKVAQNLSAAGDGSRFAIQALAVALPPPPLPPERVCAGGLILPPVYPLDRFEP